MTKRIVVFSHHRRRILCRRRFLSDMQYCRRENLLCLFLQNQMLILFAWQCRVIFIATTSTQRVVTWVQLSASWSTLHPPVKHIRFWLLSVIAEKWPYKPYGRDEVSASSGTWNWTAFWMTWLGCAIKSSLLHCHENLLSSSHSYMSVLEIQWSRGYCREVQLELLGRNIIDSSPINLI